MGIRQIIGDCREVLKTLPSESVHCVVTSPPYWGLRDYGVAGQIGLEPTFDQFIAEMVAVFREVRRVLRSDGTLWLNLGDSYAGSWGAQSRGGPPSESSTLQGNGHIGGGPKLKGLSAIQIAAHPKTTLTGSIEKTPGLKPKDLCGIPWRVAFALQADGWWLRQDIIWAKPNPMPESVTDRCTKAHEYIFLLSKSARYFYDNEAIREPHSRDWSDGKCGGSLGPNGAKKIAAIEGDPNFRNGHSQWERDAYPEMNPAGRNKRSVWEVATAPFSEAHFATFPPELIEPCIKAGCPDKCCPHCGKGWERNTTSQFIQSGPARSNITGQANMQGWEGTPRGSTQRETIGWRAMCSCPAHQPVPGTVLDPFGGAGTTGLVADRLQRNAILIELNPTYANMSQRRIENDAPLFASVSA